jgi:hypothetical protein
MTMTMARTMAETSLQNGKLGMGRKAMDDRLSAVAFF